MAEPWMEKYGYQWIRRERIASTLQSRDWQHEGYTIAKNCMSLAGSWLLPPSRLPSVWKRKCRRAGVSPAEE